MSVGSGVYFNDFIKHIEGSLFKASINSLDDSKRECLDAIKALNLCSKVFEDAFTKDTILQLSKFTLEYYDKLMEAESNDISRVMTFEERLVWIASNIGPSLYPPLIHFTSLVDSSNQEFIDQGGTSKLALELPSSMHSYWDTLLTGDWSHTPEDLACLYQDLLSNCSFVSTVLAISQTNQTDNIWKLIVPFRDSRLFKVKLYFNGAERLIEIDNRLPRVEKPHRNLTIRATNNPNLYWPALIEKAYLQLLGNGYNFEGSNMAQDCYLLLRWIPEIIPVTFGKIPTSFYQLWDLYKSSNVILGLGTGKLSSELAKKLNLISYHDYVIEEFFGGELVLKNPWIENGNQNKRYIKLADFTHISFIYVGWNPESLFKYVAKTSAIIPDVIDEFKIHRLPQFKISNTSNDAQEAWILFEKHLSKLNEESINKLTLYKSEGDKIMFCNQYKIDSQTTTNGRLMLLKARFEASSCYTIVATSSTPGAFSLSAYHNIKESVNLERASSKFLTTLPTIKDRWTIDTNGKNWAYGSFIENPQYNMEIKMSTNVLIGVHTDKSVPVGFHVLHQSEETKGIKLRNFDKAKLISSEEYREGFQHQILALEPGIFRLIISTYRGYIGPFNIDIAYNAAKEAVNVERVSSHLGIFCAKHNFQWNQNNRYKLRFKTNFRFSKFIFHLTMDAKRDEYTDYDEVAKYRPATRASVFDAESASPVVVNESWNDSLYGLFIDCSIDTGTYVLLVERLERGDGSFNISIGCNKSFELL